MSNSRRNLRTGYNTNPVFNQEDDESVKKTARVPKEEHYTVLSMPTKILEEAKEYLPSIFIHEILMITKHQEKIAVLELSFKDWRHQAFQE
nr:hypothetical protein [Tanacetum cinerariifolium]